MATLRPPNAERQPSGYALGFLPFGVRRSEGGHLTLPSVKYYHTIAPSHTSTDVPLNCRLFDDAYIKNHFSSKRGPGTLQVRLRVDTMIGDA